MSPIIPPIVYMIFVFSYPPGYTDNIIARFWGSGAQSRCESMAEHLVSDIEHRAIIIEKQSPNKIPDEVKTKGKFVCDTDLSKYSVPK